MLSKPLCLSLVVTLRGLLSPASATEWSPELFVAAETIELRTIGTEEGEYWFPVWVVVIDGQTYVRLGSRAAERVRNNQTGSEIAVRVGDRQFDPVRVEDVPELADRVAEEMAEKYWSDVFIRFFPHPLTLRLMMQPAADGKAAAE
jgi:hypothetical protein